jgi:hypothetical protein
VVEESTPVVDPEELARLAESLAKLTQSYEHALEASKEQAPAPSGRPR